MMSWAAELVPVHLLVGGEEECHFWVLSLHHHPPVLASASTERSAHGSPFRQETPLAPRPV